MKIKRLLSALLCLVMVLGIVPTMSLAAEVEGTYYVGQTIQGPGCVNSKSGYVVYDQFLSGKSDEVSISGGRITFLKPGKITVTRITESCKTTNQFDQKIEKEYFTYNVEQKTIQGTTINLYSGVFAGGEKFPLFSVDANVHYEVAEATFYKEMCDYYVGDILPSYDAGTVVNYVSITLKPKDGYIFAFDGAEDGKRYATQKYTVEYKGNKYEAYVKHSTTDNELHVYVDVTFEKGEFYNINIKDLDAPYHCGPLDKTATVDSALQVVSIKYTMFNKELASFKKGDNIGIAVRVKTKDNTNKLNQSGKAYWAEQKIYSVKTTKISDYEMEYGFSYYVDALDEQTVKWADFTIPGVYTGEALPTNAFSATDGITVKSVTWTPNDAKADASKEYTVKVEFGKKDEFVYASDFAEQGVVRINGERAKFVDETTTKGKFSNIKYYAQATFKPTTVVNADTSAKPATGTVNNSTITNSTVVSGTTTSGTTAEDAKTEDKKEETKGEETKKEETKTEDKKEETKPEEKPDNKAENKSADDYKFPFTDVPSNQWYYESVKASHKMGLINGKTAKTYNPNDNMTFAEAVKLAVCMNILYNGGDPNEDIASGKDVWYSTYMKYALDNGIIDDDLTPKANEKITRKEYVYIFSKALPEKAFAKKNNIPSGTIPDIKEEKLAQDKAIYLFYRAGVLAGNDSRGTFNPSGNITRAEVAAILIRMMDSSARVGAPKDLGK